MLITIFSCIAILQVIDDVAGEEVLMGPADAAADVPPISSRSGYLLSRWSTDMIVESGAVAPDGEGAYGDIGASVCVFDGDGAIIRDEEVTDSVAVDDADDDTILTHTATGMSVLDDNVRRVRRWERPDVRVAALREDGAVALTLDGQLAWLDDAGEVDVDAPGCDHLALDRATDTAWLGCEGELRAANARGSWVVAQGVAGLVSWSETLGVVVTVSLDGRTVRAITPAGETLWTSQMGGRVRSVTAVGGSPTVALLVEGEATEVVLLDGDTGAEIDSLPMDVVSLRASREAPVLLAYGSQISYALDVELD